MLCGLMRGRASLKSRPRKASSSHAPTDLRVNGVRALVRDQMPATTPPPTSRTQPAHQSTLKQTPSSGQILASHKGRGGQRYSTMYCTVPAVLHSYTAQRSTHLVQQGGMYCLYRAIHHFGQPPEAVLCQGAQEERVHAGANLACGVQ